MAGRLLRLGCLIALLGASFPQAHAQPGVRSTIHSDVEVARLLDEIEASTSKSERLGLELKGYDEKQQLAKVALRKRVRTLYRMTRAGRAPVGAGYRAIMQHVARVKRLKGIVEVHAKDLRRLESHTGRLKGELGQARSSLEHTRARLHTVQERGGVQAPRGGGFTELLAKRPQPDFGGPPQGSGYGLRLVDEPADSGFSSLRGSLASPVSGEVRIVDASRAESDGPGLEFQAPSGTAVRSTAAGRVAFADNYGSYGQLVILDHQDGYYTVYGGLGGVEVRVGDDLSRRARIGVIGNHGNTPALFFEVRKGTRTLSPRPWLGF